MARALIRVTETSRRWWILGGACTGLFVLMLDSTIVALALPQIQHDLDASASGVQWVMNGYLLVIAALVVTGGRLGDIYGRRTLFTAGLAVFAAGSVVSGASSSERAIIAGRVLQGIGAATMLPDGRVLSRGRLAEIQPSTRNSRYARGTRRGPLRRGARLAATGVRRGPSRAAHGAPAGSSRAPRAPSREAPGAPS